jgi:hypothetical protein
MMLGGEGDGLDLWDGSTTVFTFRGWEIWQKTYPANIRIFHFHNIVPYNA